MDEDKRVFQLHEVVATVTVRFKVVVSDPEKQLAMYPADIVNDLLEEFPRVELVSHKIEKLDEGSLMDMSRKCKDPLIRSEST